MLVVVVVVVVFVFVEVLLMGVSSIRLIGIVVSGAFSKNTASVQDNGSLDFESRQTNLAEAHFAHRRSHGTERG